MTNRPTAHEPHLASTQPSELTDVAAQVVPSLRNFLTSVVGVASGGEPDSAISLLVLALSDVLNAGAQLGAMTDIVPPHRFEPDAGADSDVEPLREALARIFDGIDAFAQVADPLVAPTVETSHVSADLALIVDNLAHGLQHYDAGHQVEAMWWWQFSYLSTWGERASGVLRVLQLILTHVRLDVPDDVAQEAQFDALHSVEAHSPN
ncbi:DUF5063 domain-containing protein [Jonesia quinghaiensis]|uniref:DUF5063 domain-containing protein n=1 Tax=Jonesia quinghaiensis TaxID=262806 RepID=UPI000428B289|nr:DUF5063 domain-containing protein [Jonesia quinghaiensis]